MSVIYNVYYVNHRMPNLSYQLYTITITFVLHNFTLQKEERTRYFGSSLDSVVESDGVPVFIKKCVQIIEDRGLKAEGIYRVSGKKEDCLTLQGKYDEGIYIYVWYFLIFFAIV